jgi:hypothetical protein
MAVVWGPQPLALACALGEVASVRAWVAGASAVEELVFIMRVLWARGIWPGKDQIGGGEGARFIPSGQGKKRKPQVCTKRRPRLQGLDKLRWVKCLM